MSFTDAAVLPLCLTTAAGMLFESETLALRWPMGKDALAKFTEQAEQGSSPGPGPAEVVTVWGGSSAVGVSAIQLLKAAGYRVVGLSSARNHELLRSSGADACFDYGDERVVSQVCEFVKEKGWRSAGIIAAAGLLPPGPDAEKTRVKCGELAIGLGGRMIVSTCLARGIQDSTLR